MGKTVAITGAEGELGNILRQQLWDQGHTIRAFSRTPKVAVAGPASDDDKIGWHVSRLCRACACTRIYVRTLVELYVRACLRACVRACVCRATGATSAESST